MLRHFAALVNRRTGKERLVDLRCRQSIAVGKRRSDRTRSARSMGREQLREGLEHRLPLGVHLPCRSRAQPRSGTAAALEPCDDRIDGLGAHHAPEAGCHVPECHRPTESSESRRCSSLPSRSFRTSNHSGNLSLAGRDGVMQKSRFHQEQMDQSRRTPIPSRLRRCPSATGRGDRTSTPCRRLARRRKLSARTQRPRSPPSTSCTPA